MVRVVKNVRVAQNSSWPASTTTHASEPEQSTLTWGFSISTASVQLTQQQPSILVWRYNPSAYVFTVCFNWEKGGVGVHIPPPPPLRMQLGSQLVSITITLLGKGKTGSCGQTHEENKWCDWSSRLDPLSERSQITTDYDDPLPPSQVLRLMADSYHASL